MSELKAYTFSNMEGRGLAEYYLKSEADKVIAAQDKEIQRLENLCESYRIDCDNIAIREANAYKEIERADKKLRHQKRKRCLAMAKACDKYAFALELQGHGRSTELLKRHNRAIERKYKWLELADKYSV